MYSAEESNADASTWFSQFVRVLGWVGQLDICVEVSLLSQYLSLLQALHWHVSSQHWSQTANDNFPIKHGTCYTTYANHIQLHWSKCNIRCTIPLEPTQFPTEKSEHNEPSVNRRYVATVRSCHAPSCPMERDFHRPLAAIPMALTLPTAYMG